jgi:hypothetical protein
MMKKYRVNITISLITLIIALILLLAAIFLVFTNSDTTLKKNVSDFSIEDTTIVTKIFLADKNNNEVTLTRSSDGTWVVDGKYPAQRAKISSFLKTLKDLEVRSPVPLAARNNVITRMAVLAKKIEIYQVVPRINLFNIIRLFPGEKLTKTYYIGDVTQDNQGTFMLMKGSEDPYIVHIPGFRGFVSTRYSTAKSDWRDYTVFKTRLDEIQSVRVEFPLQPAQSYQLDLPDNQHVELRSLLSNQVIEKYDTIRVLSFLTSFADVRFESLLEQLIKQEFIDSVTASIPKTIITLKDRNGKINEVKIFRKKGFAALYMEDGMTMEPADLDRAYALVNNDEDFVLIQYFVFDKVTRTLDYLMGKN